MSKSSHQRKSMGCRAALIGCVSFGEAGKRADSPEDFPGEQQALPIALEGRREAEPVGKAYPCVKAFTLNDFKL